MALEDQREKILVRLHALLGIPDAVPGVVTNVRNRQLLTNEKRPATIVLDGDEVPAVASTKPGRREMSPLVMRMTPQVYLILKDRDGVADETQGTKLNAGRLAIIRAVAIDQPLLALLGGNGSVEYLGCETDMKSGSLLKGELRIDFALRYTFDPYQ